jgi:hypothetical protein
MRFINLFQALLDHVRVNLSRGNIRVTQHELDRAEVRTPFEKVRGKTVAQLVRRETSAQTQAHSIIVQDLPNANAAESPADPRQKEDLIVRRRTRRPGEFRTPLREVLLDGLDGLAIGSVLIASATFMILAYAAGNAIVADYLGIANVKGAGELTIFCGALVGASLGFLWYNGHPAEVFMGDVGSMALGGALGTIAILIKQEFLLVIVGGLFVVEAGSVIVQVASFKSRGKRVFRMSPLHHHFELSGWSEMKVVIRFWIVAMIFALLGLATLKLR